MTYLALSWSISRGVETYGYNICRLDDTSATGKRYRCMGGGYDMVGTVFGDWLADRYQDRLLAYCSKMPDEAAKLYWLRIVTQRHGPRISLDGACGLDSMIRVAEAIGLTVRRTSNRKGHTTGFNVEEKTP